jgi:hypothetical protein
MLSRLSLGGFSGKRRFADLSEKEILALAISAEEEDRGIYSSCAAKLRADFPGSAAVFDGMAAEEDEHRRRLIESTGADSGIRDTVAARACRQLLCAPRGSSFHCLLKY